MGRGGGCAREPSGLGGRAEGVRIGQGGRPYCVSFPQAGMGRFRVSELSDFGGR